MSKDLTKGKPWKQIVGFTIPIFIGNVFQQFYSMVDTIIVGKFVGTKALAAVGACGTIMFLILGFLMGLTIGFTVITAQKYGAGDMRAMRRTVGTAAILSVIVSVVLTIISMAGMHSLLRLMNTPSDIYQDAYSYIIVICAGIFAQVLYNILACILRAIGNSKVPLYFLIMSAVMNVVLDLLFIIVFKMGTAGAAYATVISQGISGAACLIYIIKCVPELRLTKEDWTFDPHIAKLQIFVGVPMALQFSITAVGTIIVQTALNTFGAITIAAFTTASKIEQVMSQAFAALGTTLATFSAQNLGAGKIKRIREGFGATTLIGTVYALVAAVILFFFGKYMTGLFISENVSEVMVGVDTYLRCISIFFVPLLIVNIYRNGIQGMGYGLLPMTAGIAELVGRAVVAKVAASHSSYFGICLASPAAWILAGILLIVMYYCVIRQQERVFAKRLESE